MRASSSGGPHRFDGIALLDTLFAQWYEFAALFYRAPTFGLTPCAGLEQAIT